MRFLQLVLLYLISHSIYSQNNYNVTHYTVEDGLMSNDVNGIFQDSLGVIWIQNGLGFTKLFGDKVENITGFNNEGDYGSFSMISNGFVNEKYMVINNKIYHRKEFKEQGRVSYFLKTWNGVVKKDYYNKFNYSADQLWKYVLEGDSINFDFYKYSLFGDSINLLKVIKQIDSSLADFNSIKNSYQDDEKIWFLREQSSSIILDLKNLTTEECKLPFDYISKIISLTDSSDIIHGIDTLSKKNILVLKTHENIKKLDFSYDGRFSYKSDNESNFIIEQRDSIYKLSSNQFDLIYSGCEVSEFSFNSKNELIVQETCEVGKRRLVNVTKNMTLIDEVQGGGYGFFIDREGNLYFYGKEGFTKYTKSNYQFKKWSYFAGGEDVKLAFSWFPFQSVNNKKGKAEVLFSQSTFLALQNDSIKIEKEIDVSPLNFGGIYELFNKSNNSILFNLYVYENSEPVPYILKLDSNLRSTWFSKGYEGGTIKNIYNRGDDYFLTSKSGVWKRTTNSYIKFESRLLTGAYEPLVNQFHKVNSDSRNTVDFEVFKAKDSLSPILIFDYKKEQYYVDTAQVFKDIETKPSRTKYGWFVFQNKKIFMFDKKGLKIHNQDDLEMIWNTVDYLEDKKNDRIYFASARGLLSLNTGNYALNKLYLKDDFFKRSFQGVKFNSDTSAIWFLSFYGVHRFDLDQYYQNDQIVLENYPLKETQGYKIEFVGDSLLRIFDPKGFGEMKVGKYRYIPPAPTLHFNSVRLNYESFDWSQTTAKVDSSWGNIMPYNMELRYNENHLTFDFQGISHSNKKPLNYFHMLIGADEKFYSSNAKSATYSNLDPGKYTFQVYVEDEFGGKSETLECSFEISPPFWKTWWFISLCLIAIGSTAYSGYQYNIRRLKARQAELEQEVEIATLEIREQKDEIEESHREITDSIAYAKRIQSAILPPLKLVKEHLNESFILYKPKDVVAGDFYWMMPMKDKILFAAADCTGHGVPGAMVSVICNNGLNRSVREHGLTKPGEILDKTREIVIEEFEKSEEDVKDGMDVALCALEGNTLQYAGAHNPLYIIRKGATDVEEIKANKQPIGKFDELLPYTTHTIELNAGDSIYLFSDGFVDQFGGEKGKKLKAPNFRKLLLEMQDQTMEQQRQLLDEAFEEWRGELEQIDDVCVIGVRL